MTLYSDPSARACGFVVVDDQNIVRHAYVFDFVGKEKGTLAKISRVITRNLWNCLGILYDQQKGAIKKMVVELPVGSQSARAAWYLATVHATIMSFCKAHDIDLTGYEEADIKKAIHGRSKKIPKRETIQFVFDNMPDFAYIVCGNKVTQEAIADTLAVFYVHKEDLCPAKVEKAEDVKSEPKEKVSKRKVR